MKVGTLIYGSGKAILKAMTDLKQVLPLFSFGFYKPIPFFAKFIRGISHTVASRY
ncbi:MAG: hypothetical protein RR275_07655 [Lachnospiraceae bacterium]